MAALEKKALPQKTLRPIKLGPRFLRAFEFAAAKHSKQTRKASTIPYIAHLIGVASLVLEAGGDEDLAIAALLHDVVEDCGGAPMLKEVRRRVRIYMYVASIQRRITSCFPHSLPTCSTFSSSKGN